MAKVAPIRIARHSPPVVENMEQRLLFSVDSPLALLLEMDDRSEGGIEQTAETLALLAAEAKSDLASVKELILINSDLPDIDTLYQDILGATQDRSVAVYFLDASLDGITQLHTILSNHSSIDTLHVVSHGSSGQVALGATELDLDTASQRAEDLSALAGFFTEDADLLLYGCATGKNGETLLDYIAREINIDVAASDDLTGSLSAGGDWDLEVARGVIDSSSLFADDDAATDWEGVLATINVTTVNDVFDVDSGIASVAELMADPGPDGLISLREAIFAANLQPDTDDIVLQAGTYTLTIAGGGHESGDLDIRESVNIRGQGAADTTINGNSLDRVFDINQNTVYLEDFTLTGGSENGGGSGAAIDADDVNLTLRRMIVDGNETASGIGGALYLNGGSNVTIEDTTFSNNTAGQNSAPALSAGGAIYNEGTLTVKRSTFLDNSAETGGAIHSLGQLIVEDTTFKGNTASVDGGAIYKESGVSMELDRVTFEGNQSANNGGGLWADGDTHMDYVTFSANVAGNEGGGMQTENTGNRIENSTFVGNSSAGDGAAVRNTGSLGIKGTVFWSNTTAGSDVVNGSISSLGFNSWQTAGQSGAIDSDLEGLNPLLGSLQNNGGHVKTHLPGAGSPLTDAGFSNAFFDATRTTQNGIPDIGAAEARSTSVTEKIYWVDTAERKIYRANADGSQIQFIRDTTDVPFDIEVDSENRHLYWIESDSDYEDPSRRGALMRSDLDGGNRVTLVDNILFPTGVALDIANGHAYVTADENADNGSSPFINSILRFDLDGSNETVIASGASDDPINDRMVAPTDVEYDPVNQRLYWSDRSTDASSTNAAVKVLDIGSAGSPQHVLDTEKFLGRRAYGLAVNNGTDLLLLATGPTVLTYQATVGLGIHIPFPADSHGVAYGEESDEGYATFLNGDIVAGDLASASTIISGLTSPGAIAVAYLDPINAPPVLQTNNSLSLFEGSSVSITAAALDVSDTDTSDSDIVFTVTKAPEHGVLLNGIGTPITSFSMSDINAGEVVYLHNDITVQNDQFSFTFSDGVNTSATSVFNLLVNQLNDPPEAVDDTYTVDEDSSRDLPVLDNDSDEETSIDSSSVVIVTEPANGSATVQGDGSIRYVHGGNETTSDSFQYTVEDQTGLVSNVATVSLTINPINDPPEARPEGATIAEGASIRFPAADNDTDADDGLDLASIVIVNGPDNGTATPDATGGITYQHNGSETTTDNISYTINDLSGATSNPVTIPVTLTPINDAPIAIADADTVIEGGSKILDILSNDTDADNAIDPASVIIVTAPPSGNASPNSDGTVTYTHNGAENNSDSFVYRVRDVSGALSNSITVFLTVTPVNDDPVANDDSLTLNEGESGIVDVLANDVDVDDGLDPDTLQIFTAPDNGVASINPDGTVQYTHDGLETTSDTFSYSVTDFSGTLTVVADVNVTVIPQSDNPVANPDSLTLDEGASGSILVLANDTDVENDIDSSTVSITTPPGNGEIAVNSSGLVTYAHNGFETLADSFTYTVTDATGLVSNTATVNVTITPVNDAPIAQDRSISGVEGGTTSFSPISNDSDAENQLDPASIELVALPANGNVTFAADGSAEYTHDGMETTTDTFSYFVRDLQGLASNTAQINVNILPINDAPVAVSDNAVTSEGDSILISVLDNDTDAENPASPGTVELTSAARNGTAVVQLDNRILYSHDGRESTGDSFTYRVQDADGAFSSSAAVNIDVTAVNDAPIAVSDAVSINEGESLSVDLRDNDTDAEGSIAAGTVTLQTPPSSGVAELDSQGLLSYTHNGSETLSDQLRYTVTDAEGLVSNIATLDITVIPQNDSPLTIPDSFTVTEAGQGNFDVLSNDSDADDGIDPGSVVIASPVEHGSLVLGSDGTIAYTHDGSETVSDSFSYQVADLSGSVSVETDVIVTVTPSNDSPVAVADFLDVDEGGLLEISILDNDSDAEQALDGTNIVIVSVPTNGSIASNDNGTVSYQHDASDTVIDSFEYRLVDSEGATSNVVTVQLNILPVDDLPLTQDDSFAVDEGGVLELDVLANDSDSDSTLAETEIEIIESPLRGSLTVLDSGLLSYAHDGSESSSDEFSYRLLTETGQASSPATVQIEVLPVNDAPQLTVEPTLTLSAPYDLQLSEEFATDVDTEELTYTATLPDGSALPDSVIFDADTLTLSAAEGQSRDLPEAVLILASDGQGGETSLLVMFLEEPILEAALPNGPGPTFEENLQTTVVVPLFTTPVATDEAEGVEEALSPGDEDQSTEENSNVGNAEQENELATGVVNPDNVLLLAAEDNNRLISDLEEAYVSVIYSDQVDEDQVRDESPANKASLLPSDAMSLSDLLGKIKLDDSYDMSLLNSALDDINRGRGQEELEIQEVLVRTTVASSAVSLGYVLWLVRGGVLFSSMMSALPAWRIIDPLPILSHLDEQELDDTESLQSMVK